MCHFLSWIEIDNVEIGKLVLFLTDIDILSTYGRKIFSDCIDNDVIGHGAIRRYYNLRDDEGKNCENTNFWETDKFPKEVQVAIDNFDKNFKKIFSTFLSNDDYRYIVAHGPEKFSGKAWELLLSNNPNNYDYQYIIEFSNGKFADKAWELLLSNNPSNHDYRYIVTFGPEKFSGKAWELLVNNNPSNVDYRDIVTYGPEKFKKLAREKLKSNSDK